MQLSESTDLPTKILKLLQQVQFTQENTRNKVNITCYYPLCSSYYSRSNFSNIEFTVI